MVHLALSRIVSTLCLVHGHDVYVSVIYVCVFQVGPGVVFLLFDHSFLGRGVIMHCVTPVEPLLQCVSHTIFYQSNIPPLVPKFILRAECIQVPCIPTMLPSLLLPSDSRTHVETHRNCTVQPMIKLFSMWYIIFQNHEYHACQFIQIISILNNIQFIIIWWIYSMVEYMVDFEMWLLKSH